MLLKTSASDARLNRLNSAAPIRTRAAEEGDFQIPIWGIPFILFLLYVCLFSGLGALGLVGPDEPRYAAIARAMADTHDWVTPTLWGTPWFEKPVLYYWTAGIAMRIFGVGEFAARLPSALAALLAVAAVKWTALRSYGVATAWYSLLMLPASVAMIGFARAASPDMLFAGLLTVAMAIASEMLQSPRPGLMPRIAFGFFLGAAVLAKGPAAVILAGAATLLWAALSHQWRAPFRFLHPLLIVVFCVTALPWYALCALRNPDFLRVFIWQHNFQRYLTPIFEHRQPFWFYVPVLAVALFPWSAMALGVLRTKWNKKEWQDSPGLFLLCWAFVPFVFFSLSQSKLPGYILPSIPPAMLLVSREVARAFASDKRRAAIWTGITGVLFVVLGGVLARSHSVSDVLSNGAGSSVTGLMLVTVAGGIIAVLFSLSNYPLRALITDVLLVAALVLFMNLGILPEVDSRISARSVARQAQVLIPLAGNVSVHGLNRNWNYGLSYYFNRELPEWEPGAPQPEWLFTSSDQAIQFLRPQDQVFQMNNLAGPGVELLHRHPPSDSARQTQ